MVTPADRSNLLRELLALPGETEWVEFKENYQHPDEIGEYISALANAAALHEREFAYLVWGVENVHHRAVGTTFRPRDEKVGNQEIENWLATLLSPRIDFRIFEYEYDSQRVVVFEIPPARMFPVRFKRDEFIRVGTYKKKLREHPDKERRLWALFRGQSFEDGVARAGVSSDDVLSLLDYPAYFDLTSQPLPDNRIGIMDRLASERLVTARGLDLFDVTNLGAILFAKDLSRFQHLARKALRVIIYRGANRTETEREQTGVKGYAVGFEGAVGFINDHLPQNEEIGQALRKEVRLYPEIAIRELVANALIHQDFNVTGAGPTAEIFSDRMEITNPGRPLIDTLRFIDQPPRSRNEALASFLRRINICEERGSGIDKIVRAVEVFQLPAPEFNDIETDMKVVLFAPRSWREMDKLDRVRACYQHACLRYVSNDKLTNASLRQRFSIADENYAMASRIISDTLEAELIKPYDPSSRSRRHAKYVPFWA